jgi:AmmeMemoRadiSam system protein B
MQKRKSFVAGSFYPGQYSSCVDEINHFLDTIKNSESLPDQIVAGLVPHAGWTYSGSLAVSVFSGIKQQHEKVHTFIILGATHRYFGNLPAVYDRGFWETPLGEAAVNEELADAVLRTKLAVSDSDAHISEHSIEVQIPFIQYLFPGAKILPILVPPGKEVVEFGEGIGEIIEQETGRKIVCIGSTDLTHYGPGYGFTPMGVGQKALGWAFNENDKKFIDLALDLKPQDLLYCAIENGNACGPGAAAATVATAKKLGSEKGLLLGHTNSNEIMQLNTGAISNDSVGYAAIIF